MTGSANDHRTAKQRILEAADYLFANEGIHHVAIDRIIADPRSRANRNAIHDSGSRPIRNRSARPAASRTSSSRAGR